MQRLTNTSSANKHLSAQAEKKRRTAGRNASRRRLMLESLEGRWMMASDTDDQILEAISLGTLTSTAKTASDSISPDTDVDMYGISVTAGQTIDFDIDTVENGGNGLGSYLRLFNSAGQQLATNNDAGAPGENVVGFDAYLRYTFTIGGNYYLGVSNANNLNYNPVTGDNDTAGGQFAIGNYTLTVQALPVDTDDSLNEATLLGQVSATPFTVNAAINPDIDVDFYRFTVSSGQIVDIDIDTVENGTTGLGSYIRLFDALGNQLAFNNDGAAPGENVLGFDAYLRYTFPAAGTYFVGVSNANNTSYNPVDGTNDFAGGLYSIGNYTLIMQTAPAVPVDPDDAISEAVSLGALTTTPITTSGAISPDVDVDMVRFTVAANQTVDFDIDTTLNGTGGLGSFLRLFNAQGAELALNNDANAPGENSIGFDAYLRFTFTTAGTYYLGVSNANNPSYNAVTGNGDLSGGANATGDYQLIIQALPVDPDDSTIEAIPLGQINQLATSRSSTIAPDIDVDVYSFQASAGQTIDFDIDTALNGTGGLGSYLRVFNAQGNELASNNDGVAPGEVTLGFDAYLRYTFTTAGTYYLGISNNTNISYNVLTGGGDTAGGFNTIGDYTLNVSEPTAAPIDLDDSIGESILLGTVSTTPLTANGEINPDVDVDMYRFTVTAGQIVDFDIDTALNGTGGLGSYIRLFNASGVQLAANNDANAPGENSIGFDSYLRFTFTTAGTYYLGVSNVNNLTYDPLTGGSDTAGGANAIGAYQLSAYALPIDPDDQTTEATSLGTPSTSAITRSGTISPDVDVDLYSFTVAAGQIVDFDIDTATNGGSGLNALLRIFSPSGVVIQSNDNATATGENTLGFDSYLRFTFTASGTYFVGVSNATNSAYNAVTGAGDAAGGFNTIGDYQLIVQTPAAAPVDGDDAISEAVSLGNITTVPISTSGTINPDVDVDMYRFNVVAGQVVDFDIDTTLNGAGGLGSYLRLFNSTGQELAFNNDGIAPGETTIGFDAYLRYTFATAGTYYIAVSNANNISFDAVTGNADTSGGANSTGDYQLIVQALPSDPDDTLLESVVLGAISTTPISVAGTISPDIDVDMYRFTVSAGQIVEFDIDTALNGPGGLGSYLRLFNSSGQQLALNNDATAPGETTLGFDAWLQYTFATAGTYYIGVSNSTNILYDAQSGNLDTAGGANSIGDYQLTVATPSVTPDDSDDAISEAASLGTVGTTAITTAGTINPDSDVDMYTFIVVAGQTVDFDIDTTLNGSTGLNSLLRLFNAQGQQLALNNNAAAPGESTVGLDAYTRFTFATAGTYYVAVSNATNTGYDPLTGSGDASGGSNATGDYQLIVVGLPLDPDDTLIEAPSIGGVSTTANTISGTISPDIDVDIVRFTVTDGQTVDFDIDTTLNGPGGLGSFLRLFNASGQQLAGNDNAAAPGESTLGLDAYLRYSFALGGTYYISVSNSTNILYDPVTGNSDIAGGANSTGDYTLVIQAVSSSPTDTDDAISEAPSIGTVSTTPVTTSGSISPDTDVDMVRFTVTAGQVVDFDIDTTNNGPGGLQSYLRLFDVAGQQLTFSDNATAPGESTLGFDAYLRFTFATAGTYYVAVSNATNITYNAATGDGDASGSQNSTGDYVLIIGSPASQSEDPDDTITKSTSLGTITTTANSTSATISPDTDVDVYSFSVSAGQVIDFDIDTTANGPGGLGSYLRLFNAAGQQLAANDNANAPGESTVGFDAYLRFTFATAGTYYVAVSNSTNITYDPQAGTGDTAGGANSTGAYQLILQTPSTEVGDPDDAISEATQLGAVTTTEMTVTDSILIDTDVDLFGFTVTAGLVIDFDIDTVLNGSTGLNSLLRLFNVQGQELATNNNAVSPGEEVLGLDAYVRYTFSTAGTYFIGVSNANNGAYSATTGDGDTAGGSNATGNYQLRIKALPIDTDDAISEASFVGAISSTAKNISGSIDPDIDVDMIRFTVTAGLVVDFDIDTASNGPGGLNSYLRVFDAAGVGIALNNNAAAPGESSAGYDAYLRFTFTTAGTYYVSVSNATNMLFDPITGDSDTAGGLGPIGSYQLTIQAVTAIVEDTDDAISEATSIGALSTTAKSVDSEIAISTDVNMVSFTVTAGQSVNFDIDTSSNGGSDLQSYLRLFNSGGSQLAANDNAAAPGEGTLGFDAYLNYTFATAGTYYIAVSNASNITYDPISGNGDATSSVNATGTYTLTLQVDAPVSNPTLTLITGLNSIPEINGSTIATVTRADADTSVPLTVNISSSNTSSATVPSSIVIPAGQSSASFTITAVHDTNQGTRSVTITASSTGFAPSSKTIQIVDSDGTGHNGTLPADTNADGSITPFDALLVINYLNATGGGGPVPAVSPPFLDVNADGFVTAIDALIIINQLNVQVGPEAEGEAAADAEVASVVAGEAATLLTAPATGSQETFTEQRSKRWAAQVDQLFGLE